MINLCNHLPLKINLTHRIVLVFTVTFTFIIIKLGFFSIRYGQDAADSAFLTPEVCSTTGELGATNQRSIQESIINTPQSEYHHFSGSYRRNLEVSLLVTKPHPSLTDGRVDLFLRSQISQCFLSHSEVVAVGFLFVVVFRCGRTFSL